MVIFNARAYSMYEPDPASLDHAAAGASSGMEGLAIGLSGVGVAALREGSSPALVSSPPPSLPENLRFWRRWSSGTRSLRSSGDLSRRCWSPENASGRGAFLAAGRDVKRAVRVGRGFQEDDYMLTHLKY